MPTTSSRQKIIIFYNCLYWLSSIHGQAIGRSRTRGQFNRFPDTKPYGPIQWCSTPSYFPLARHSSPSDHLYSSRARHTSTYDLPTSGVGHSSVTPPLSHTHVPHALLNPCVDRYFRETHHQVPSMSPEWISATENMRDGHVHREASPVDVELNPARRLRDHARNAKGQTMSMGGWF